MKFALSALILAAGLLVAAPEASAFTGPGKKGASAQAAESYKVDTKASQLEWYATKVTGKHNGTVALQGGSVAMTGGKLTGGDLVVDMNTITDVDIKDEGYRAKLMGHLKSDDFFGVEKFPTAQFKITKAEPIKGAAAGQPNYSVTGDMMIKGKTNAVTFPATVTTTGNTLKATGSMTIDRSKYDVRYGSTSFFDNLGDKAISNDFIIKFDLTAVK